VLSIALGHDQTASLCPWVQLTRSTADYPSRKASIALALRTGLVQPTPDVVDLVFRCDGCGRCQELGKHAHAGCLSDVLYEARAMLSDRRLAPEIRPLRETWEQCGSVYGDPGKAIELLCPGDGEADVLFVPGTAMLAHEPAAAVAAFHLVGKFCVGGANVRPDLLDSGWVLKELGLRESYETEREHICDLVKEVSCSAIVAGTPKETYGLTKLLGELPVEVEYAGSLVAKAMTTSRPPLRNPDPGSSICFHPSEYLLHHLGEYDTIERGLRAWLGDAFLSEFNAKQNARPAAIERPLVRADPVLIKGLAERRAAQLVDIGGTALSTVLTVDPFSQAAVVDLLTFVARHLTENDVR
jgi:hypothetical protein